MSGVIFGMRECVFRKSCDSTATILQVSGFDISDCDLERLLSFFLLPYAGMSTLIAEVWNANADKEFPFSYMKHPVQMKNRVIGNFPKTFVPKLRKNWFSSRCTLFCIGNTVASTEDYVKRIKKLCPEKALRKRFFKRMSVAMKLRDMHSEFLISILNCRSLFAIIYGSTAQFGGRPPHLRGVALYKFGAHP